MSDVIRNIVQKTISKHSANKFQPTEAHRRAKSAFWSHFFSSGEVPPPRIEAAAAARFSGYNDVIDWWEIPGFEEWFGNGEEFRQRVEYVSNLALDVLQTVLQDEGARTGDKLQAAKMVLEVGSKFPKTAQKEQFSDAKIQEMTREQLEEFIAKKLQSVSISTESTPEVTPNAPV